MKKKPRAELTRGGLLDDAAQEELLAQAAQRAATRADRRLSPSEELNAIRRTRARIELAVFELRTVAHGEQLGMALETLEQLLEELRAAELELENES
jgi:hypothetical protein